eukprot:NODE_3868_length_396_cov_1.097983_g3429_i0.p3 GENE.NODE_3868_length_396_cov_1.097983_g3429_i0~~NODE_3868_length_396_cov_1.097983_g3429_i0.p3  ORF type:complete len:89 (+),score=30.17 NODE_3868_length_396_cov_1.097983_g3429_i0:65-331(+)
MALPSRGASAKDHDPGLEGSRYQRRVHGEINAYWPLESFPEVELPPDVSRDPKAPCWRLLEAVALRPALYRHPLSLSRMPPPEQASQA